MEGSCPDMGGLGEGRGDGRGERGGGPSRQLLGLPPAFHSSFDSRPTTSTYSPSAHTARSHPHQLNLSAKTLQYQAPSGGPTPTPGSRRRPFPSSRDSADEEQRSLRAGGGPQQIGNIGLNWMRVNGAFQNFRHILSSASNKTPEPPDPPTSHLSSTLDPGLALINLESGGGGKYLEEGSETGSKLAKGVAKSNAQRGVVSSRLVRRKNLYEKRKLSSDYALFFALLGILLMICENELSAANFYFKSSEYSYAIKTLIVLTTLVLLALIAMFHILEVKLFMNDNSAEDWRIAMTWHRTAQVVVEMGICAVCPVPGDFSFRWTTVHADGQTVTTTDVPLDVLLSIPMFLRLYLIGRVMLLHSRLFTDASSRSIGALNRVHFNARFVLKTLMTLCPGTVLLVFTASLWVIAGWILRLCERYHVGSPPNVQALKHQNYLNSLWMVAITFLSVGYGDIVPNTYCGRAVAVITGIMGAGTASMVVAVIARKLELTRAEKHVHNFMMDTQLTKRLKHAAANVLRETWLIYKHRRLVEKINPSRIRRHQRKFLLAIYELRKVKRDQRKLSENSMTVADIVKTASNTFEMVSDLHSWQQTMEERLSGVEETSRTILQEVQDISRTLTAINSISNPVPPATSLRKRSKSSRQRTESDVSSAE